MRDNVVNVLESCNAILDAHFVLTSGKHARYYVNKDAVFLYPGITSMLSTRLAELFVKHHVEAVIAPAVGGVILSHSVALSLSNIKAKEVLSTFADKDAGGFVMKRGYDKAIVDKRVLVVEDVLTTGTSVKKVIRVAREHAAKIVGVGALVNRGKLTAHSLGVPVLKSLVKLDLESWSPEQCPLCQKGVSINTNVGKGM